MSTGNDPDARREVLEAAFGVAQMSHSYENLLAWLSQGGAPPADILSHLVRRRSADTDRMVLGNDSAEGAPFDHIEVWGRSGTPLFLIGHPYQISVETEKTLGEIRRLGMDVAVDKNSSWYKTISTFQVRVCHLPTVAKVIGPSRARP